MKRPPAPRLSAMELGGLHDYLNKLMDKGQLPAFLCGALAGGALVVLLVKYTRMLRSSGLVKELRDQIAELSATVRRFQGESEAAKEQNQGLRRERDLLHDKVKAQEGHIEALQLRAAEISTICETLK